MRSTFHGLETSRRGLFSSQTAMNTAGHNVANANTTGYSRQVVNFSASNPMEFPAITKSTVTGQLGTGVEYSSITRARESFLDDQFRNEYKGLGDWTVRKDTLEKIETIINEPSEYGLRSVLDSFWNGWQDLANQPDNLTARSVVMENSVALTGTINDMAKKLTDLENDISESINIKTIEANTLINQIAELNGEIYKIESLGDKSNDLRDQRDLLTDQLSKLINIDVKETNTGYTITSGSLQLVSGKTASLLDPNALPADINSGELHGYLKSIENVNSFQAQLDELVNGLVQGEFEMTLPAGTVVPDGTTLTDTNGNSVTYLGANRTLANDTTIIVKGINGLHQLGYTLQEPLQAGGLFFTTKDGSSDYNSANITLNPDIVNDVSNIAASTATYTVNTATGTQEKVVKGNNQLALWIGGLRNVDIKFGQSNETGTTDEYFRSMVGELGVKTSEAVRQANNQEVLVTQIDTRRQSISGVSIDEEMANIVKFQHSYNASARMISVIDEMLDKIINGMGVAGR